MGPTSFRWRDKFIGPLVKGGSRRGRVGDSMKQNPSTAFGGPPPFPKGGFCAEPVTEWAPGAKAGRAPPPPRPRILLMRRVSSADICMGDFLMSCCQGQTCCRCCCGGGSNSGNGGISTLPSFPDLPVYPGGGSAANTRWPVYLSFPAFLWDAAGEQESGGSCGCCT